MTEHLYAAIMAGGGGTRLWPLSRKDRPKQSLRLIGNQSLFQMAMQRIEPLIPIDRSLILTIREQAELLRAQVPELEDSNFILEPGPRGTASVIGLAAIYLRRRDPDAVMACLTADHYIPAVQSFQQLLRAAYEIAQQKILVTLGISPTSPDIGYGYIHRGEEIELTSLNKSYQVKEFTEKPDLNTAESYLRSGEYYWNSGMFIWHVDAILDEIQRQLPELYKCLMKIEKSIGTDDEFTITESLWTELESITVDYGIMEGAEHIVVLPADDLGWIDIGDWGRLFDILPHDALNNVVSSKEAELIDSKGIFVFQDVESSERLIAGLGIEDLVIIDTGDVLFVCPRSKASELKKLIEKLKGSNLERYL
jgi:mannose-1-phosphate guanylyltransferase